MSAPKSPVLLYFLTAAATMAETSAILGATSLPMGIIIALGLHIATLAVSAAWAIHAYRRYDDRFGLFLLPLIACAGAFGAGIGFLAVIVHGRCAPDAQSPVEWIEGLFAHDEDRETDHLHERIAFGLDDFEAVGNVEPFRDILSGGSVLQKQMAIAKIARYFRPAFAPLLLQAARDTNSAVRVQAATALAKIERDFMARYMKLENALRDVPDQDPAKLELAQLYDDYAHAGLLDDNNRQALRQKAINIYEACLAERSDPDWRIKLARLYVRENKPELACAWLEPIIAMKEPPRGATLWYMEALFQMKKFGDLRQLAERQMPILKRTGDYHSIEEMELLPDLWDSQARPMVLTRDGYYEA